MIAEVPKMFASWINHWCFTLNIFSLLRDIHTLCSRQKTRQSAHTTPCLLFMISLSPARARYPRSLDLPFPWPSAAIEVLASFS
jgi:hypothetical protein